MGLVVLAYGSLFMRECVVDFGNVTHIYIAIIISLVICYIKVNRELVRSELESRVSERRGDINHFHCPARSSVGSVYWLDWLRLIKVHLCHVRRV